MFLAETGIEKELDALLKECTEKKQDTQMILFVTADDIEEVSKKINDAFPMPHVMGVQSYYFRHGVLNKNGTVLMFIENDPSEFEYSYGIIEDVSTDPAKDILEIQKKVANIHPGNDDTICLEFCTGGEDRLMTTLNSVMKEHGITVFGATTHLMGSSYASRIFYGRQLYDDACIYILIRNLYGRIITYSQNIYKHHSNGQLYIATKVDKEARILMELDGRPAAEVYCEELGISLDDISDAYPYHPLSKCIGEDNYLVSIRECNPDGSLTLCKQINQNDLLYINDIDDYKNIITEKFSKLGSDLPDAATILTIDCLYRYLLFEKEGSLDWYAGMLDDSGLNSLGIVGMSEQYDIQNSNQTMISAIFERKVCPEDPLDIKEVISEGDACDITAVQDLTTEICHEEHKQKKETLNARIYPLDFMLHYVMKTKDSIVQRETYVLKTLLMIQRRLRQILKNDNPMEIHDYAERILSCSHAMADRLAAINLQIEDMSNMLDQTEYLINDVVYLDGLTGLLNRAFFNIMGDDLFDEAQEKNGMSIAFFDIDDFKHFNTDFGHDFGDQVLKELAMVLKGCFRSGHDIHLIRMGGDEFMILNPSVLSYEQFVERMNLARERVSKHKVYHDHMEAGLTISIGMADSKSEGITSMWNLYRSADSRLYEAKDAGKNQIKAYSN
ncbi:hypothetical protein BXO88_13450 [Oribacterium sp. C9]|uniref:sensor domain-containing diguanylate cyclase n=1 Tax=Oribacterium sp. C9 TaxID=1943579 RepID=UPI00098FF351|nr:diguanylate cyclase [Oribacterium sp. C9]OON85267.1 hypothetical protein BXO88_13450 [Oribacterium sp. C9]